MQIVQFAHSMRKRPALFVGCQKFLLGGKHYLKNYRL